MWILQHAPAEYGYDDLSTLQDENGNMRPKANLQWIVNNLCHNQPHKIVELVESYDHRYRVEFTPPYWPHVQPVELMWNNLKDDYRKLPYTDKIHDVKLSVRNFMETVPSSDCEGWVRHTDDFCAKIVNRDEATLAQYEILM